MKSRGLVFLLTAVVIVITLAVLADRTRTTYQHGKVIARNPATPGAKDALETVLREPVVGKILVKKLLERRFPDFALEFRRRLYRQAFRGHIDAYRGVLLDDFEKLVHGKSPILDDGTLIASFPDPSSTRYQDTLAAWTSRANEDQLASFYWALKESPVGTVTSADLRKESQRLAGKLIRDFRSNPDTDTDLLVNTGFRLERMARPGLKTGDSEVLKTMSEALNNNWRSRNDEHLSAIDDAEAGVFLYQQCRDPIVRSWICARLVDAAPEVAARNYDAIKKTLSPIDDKAYLCHLAGTKVQIPGFKTDDAFRGSAPRIVTFNIYNIVDEPSFQIYATATGKAYFEEGKMLPLGRRLKESQVRGLTDFVTEFPWHPGADDAYFRLADSYFGARQTGQARLSVFKGLSSTDTDAHPYLKLLLVESLVAENEVPRPDEAAGLISKLKFKGAQRGVDAMISTNKLAFLLPAMMVRGDPACRQAIECVKASHRVGHPFWKMSSLAWEAVTDYRPGWVETHDKLSEYAGRPAELVKRLSKEPMMLDSVSGMPSNWDSLTLKLHPGLLEARTAMLRNSLIYQLFAWNKASGGSTGDLGPLLVRWMTDLRKVPDDNMLQPKGADGTFPLSAEEREVLQWLVDQVNSGKWKSYPRKELQNLLALAKQ